MNSTIAFDYGFWPKLGQNYKYENKTVKEETKSTVAFSFFSKVRFES